MRSLFISMIIAVIFTATIFMHGCKTNMSEYEPPANNEDGIIKLPAPKLDGDVSVERALHERRSIREYADDPMTLKEISQICWAAQGITDKARSLKSAPSAGALYPLEVYVVTGSITELSQGVYRYLPEEHGLVRITDGDIRNELSVAGLSQSSILKAPVSLVFSAFYKKTTQKYGERGIRYVHIEAGHASQNVYLQAVSLGLGTVAIGAFNESEVRELLEMSADEQPLYIMPIGKLASK